MSKQPVCDCGGELEYEVEKLIPFVRYKIRQDGTLYKNPTKISDIRARYGQYANWGSLICDKCGNEYEYDANVKGVVIRGEKIR